ncbi:MAG: hypothetical protein Q9159_000906 [Coniocarpon cinnabarinum]
MADEKDGPKSSTLDMGSVDEAMKAQQLIESEHLDCDAATSKRLVRRIDLMILPVSAVTARCSGFRGLTKIADYVHGYLGWELPAGRLMQRLPLAKYLGVTIILWGIVLACMAALRNYQGAIAVRFFLGLLEASIMPGFALVVSQWYTQLEQGKRIGIFVSFNGLAQVFGGLVAYGLAHGATIHHFSLSPWRVLFLFTGLWTIVAGIALLVLVPDTPLSAWWLSPVDRGRVVQRLRGNHQGIKNKTWKLYQVKEALTDPLTWAYTLLAILSDIPNGGITNFFNLLIKGFGFTAEESLLYGTPAGAVEFIALIVWAFASRKWGYRSLWAIPPMIIYQKDNRRRYILYRIRFGQYPRYVQRDILIACQKRPYSPQL